MRTKVVKVDNAEYTIGALTLNQVEQLGEAAAAELDGQKVRARWMDIVLWGLNAPLAEGEKRWDEPRVKAELDLVSFRALSEAVIGFSGLTTKAKGSQPGEAVAPLETLSTSSDGAQLQ